MKKLLLASFLAATFGLAHADDASVQIYGRVDMSVESSTNVGNPNGNALALVSSGDYASKIGFKGQENLGGGSVAGFQLENGFTPNDGNMMQNANNGQNSPLFNRGANVFLGNNSYGKVTLGRQDNSAERAWENYGEARPGSNLGTGLVFWDDASSFGGTATSKTGIGTQYSGGYFVSDAIRYDTPKIYGLQGSVQYVAGGVSGDGTFGNVDAGNKYLVDVTYDYGPFGTAVGWVSSKNSSGVQTGQTTYVVGKYTGVDRLTVAGGFTNFQNPNGDGAQNTDFNLYMISAKYAVTPQTDVGVGYYKLTDKIDSDNGARQVSLYANYKFSKRTYVYAGIVGVNNNGASGFGSTANGTGNYNLNTLNTSVASVMQNPGMVQTSYIAGLSYTF